MTGPVVYRDWRGEEWLENGGRRCRHLPTNCVFDLWFNDNGDVHAVLRQGSAPTELFELAKGYYKAFGTANSDLQPPGFMTGEP
jgi:hypothetical protein